jgi:hypothetical protein
MIINIRHKGLKDLFETGSKKGERPVNGPEENTP